MTRSHLNYSRPQFFIINQRTEERKHERSLLRNPVVSAVEHIICCKQKLFYLTPVTEVKNDWTNKNLYTCLKTQHSATGHYPGYKVLRGILGFYWSAASLCIYYAFAFCAQRPSYLFDTWIPLHLFMSTAQC